VGLEVIRGDWAQVAKLVQEKVLEIILKDQSPTEAANYVHAVIFGVKAKTNSPKRPNHLENPNQTSRKIQH